VNTVNAHQTDALREVVNIAFGLSVAKLSEVSGQRVVMGIPIIGVYPAHVLATEAGLFFTGPAVSVHQAFSGPISGDAILLLNHAGAEALSSLLEDQLHLPHSGESTREILTEIGNIVLGTYLGAFGNLFEVRVSFSVPSLYQDSLDSCLMPLSNDGELRHAIVIEGPFRMREQEVDGRLLLILAASSLEQWIQAVEQWECSQTGKVFNRAGRRRSVVRSLRSDGRCL
jgi:chemotaxis protein CheC